MISSTKKYIWQANPLVREGTKFLQISILKVIDLETFGPPSGSKAFETISGPAGQGCEQIGQLGKAPNSFKFLF